MIMTIHRTHLTRLFGSAFTCLICMLLFGSGVFAADSSQATIAGYSKEEALKLGERMYRAGILPSGEAMQALVQGDIPVDSTMFSCMSCHLKSGFGSVEGRVITLPTDGTTLYKPLTKAWLLRWLAGASSRYAKTIHENVRSAYSDESLATALRGGVNPDGKTLNYTMPRYLLEDNDMAIMVYYLKNLSVGAVPGVTGNAIRFATIITDGVNPAEKAAMLKAFDTLSRISKYGTKSLMAQRSKALDPLNLRMQGYMNVSVATWKLNGPPETWREQLEAYNKKEPVFALIGGLATGDWQPIHAFCEDHRIPCILPLTDAPVISDTDWYTLYFSKGFYQEGEASARYLRKADGMTDITPVIQIYRDTREGRAIAKGFTEAWADAGMQPPSNMALAAGTPVNEDFWKKLAADHKGAAVLLWLNEQDIAGIATLSGLADRPSFLFVSSSLVGKGIYALPDPLRKIIHIAYPYRLPDDPKSSSPLFATANDAGKPSAMSIALQAKLNFIYMMMPRTLFMMNGAFHRDRFLEVIDMMRDETMEALYPRLSFGPGQRYTSKGCYILQLSEGPSPKVIRVSDWVIQ